MFLLLMAVLDNVLNIFVLLIDFFSHYTVHFNELIFLFLLSFLIDFLNNYFPQLNFLIRFFKSKITISSKKKLFIR